MSAHAGDSDKTGGIAPKRAADFIHAVIQANRTIYSEYIVERLGETLHLKSTENWEKENALPLPAQFLLLSAKMIESRGSGMNYRLMSLWPINKNNSPRTDFERSALQEVTGNPKQPIYGIIQSEGKWAYQAVYPDIAVTKACVECHNSHVKSEKKDYKRGDAMGGIVVTLPLGRYPDKDAAGQHLIPPEVVSDYVHAILEADRTNYADHIVNRLQNKNIVYASEHWWEENALLLPAQFLLNASDLIKNSDLGLDFRLISLWPINKYNGPANEFERRGLESVAANPLRPFIGQNRIGNKKFFQAIYPDLAVTPACISCHNAHPKSPKHDFKLYDVLGGILVILPFDQGK
ncbi:MAG: DUF3365 domain-containing protein [Nitrospinae bacterium]|nr:DUF3365 domain-containing protein [Nitrospinota bacterium]